MTSSSLLIRPARESDKSAIWKIFIEMIRNRITVKNPDRDWALRHIQGHLKHRNEIFLLAFVDNKPVGAILTRLASKKRAHVFGAYVEPPFRQKGVMQALGARLEQALYDRGISEIEIRVQSDNKIARTVLKALGFRALNVTYQKDLL